MRPYIIHYLSGFGQIFPGRLENIKQNYEKISTNGAGCVIIMLLIAFDEKMEDQMIRIVTDNGSDITREEAAALGIERVVLETAFEDGACPMDTDQDYAAFYEKLKNCDKLPITSRPAPQQYLDIYLDAKEKGDGVVVISLSSGLSGTYESACVAKNMAEYDNIRVIDSQQAVMSQRILVEHAVKMRDANRTLDEIVSGVKDVRRRVRVVGIIGSLVYLKKGGRIPPALALIGDALGIKPVITVAGKVIQPVGKVRGVKAGISLAYKMMEEDGIDPAFAPCFGYTSNREMGENFMNETKAKFGIEKAGLARVSGIIGTHLGTDSIGVAYVKKHEE